MWLAARIWRHTNILVSTVKATTSFVLHSLSDLQPTLAVEKDGEQNLTSLHLNRTVIFFPKSKGPHVLMMRHHMIPSLPRQAMNFVQLTLLVTVLNSWGIDNLAP